MSQAARCPSCRTVFRVQPQQLQASGGWARCGQCGEVFNALQALVAMPQQVPPAPARTGSPLDRNPPPVSSLYRRAEPTPAAMPPGGGTPSMAAPAPGALPREAATPPATATPRPAAPVPPSTPAAVLAQPPRPPSPAPAPVPQETDVRASTSAMPPDLNSVLADDAAPSAFMDAATAAPSFMQAPAPAARVTDTQRTWWTTAATVLVLMALLQALIIARPALSARFPGLRPLMQPLCVLMRCNAEAAPRHLAALAVESSALSRLSGSEQRYRLSLLLRNRDTQALRWPAVELRLTDAQGVLLVRKVLRARELGATVAAIPPAQEIPLQAVLDVGDPSVAGYSVELFYP
ncbi:zinc-ribbon and DUF3426 domain-containing protein [uncultured Azohydromonas sp.]|uniref:zinc-ribbon and DUF3426 domain-containing protein n=1 Tax=uncultured Azohydromonas sp. TaxID=487342 RepID=UPI002603B645|nr:zinc-ribbon and DUF3426 domain-containing protein [uncultured Azohydromonas sp.]